MLRDMSAAVIFAGMVVVSILVACSGKNTTPIEQATVVQDEGASAHVCRVRYRSLNREVPCDQVATVMQSELHISTSVGIVVQSSKETRYEQVGRLIQLLNDAGYMTEFPSH